MSYLALSVPRTGLEPARLSALAPETSASTIPPPGHRCHYGLCMEPFAVAKLRKFFYLCKFFRVFLFFLARMGWVCTLPPLTRTRAGKLPVLANGVGSHPPSINTHPPLTRTRGEKLPVLVHGVGWHPPSINTYHPLMNFRAEMRV